MNRVLLLVAERPAGWHSRGIAPLLNEAECGNHAALAGAGLPVEVAGLSHFLEGPEGCGSRLVVLVRPTEGVLRALEAKMQATGGCLLAVRDGDSVVNDGVLRMVRTISGVSIPLSLELSRLSRFRSARGLRAWFSLPHLAKLRSTPEDQVVARWHGRKGAAILRRDTEKLRSWSVGFPLDHLEPPELSKLLQIVAPAEWTPEGLASPIPAGTRAVVLLLHDVEEALPGDSRGTQSVRDGIETCLETQARHNLRATYNLVGTFAQGIPDLVRRMANEGHEIASHGCTHRVVAELTAAELGEEVEGSEERIGALCGAKIRGFRSPRSRWSSSLLDILHRRGYLWNAEGDPSPYPYQVPRGYARPLVRIPVAVDDWDYVRHRASPGAVSRLWRHEVLRAMETGCWVAIGSHPSVLGAHPERMSAFGEFVRWLAAQKVAVLTHGEAAEWWLARIRSGGGGSRAATAGAAEQA